MADKLRIKNSRFDMKGNYEPSDSENEYSPTEKKLLEKVRKRGQNNDSEEDVYAFSDSDDSHKKGLEMADSDVEGQEKSDDDLPDSKAWGKKKKSFYSTDYVDEDYGGFQDDEEAALMEEEEAKNIQKRLMEQLEDDDFSLDFFPAKCTQKNAGEGTLIKNDLSQMSKRQKQQLLEKESPELSGLVEDFKTKVTIVKDDLRPILNLLKEGKIEEVRATAFMRTNHILILDYILNVSVYLILKSQKYNVQNHPMLKRLHQYRQMLKQMEPIYTEFIKPQIKGILNEFGKDLVYPPIRKIEPEPTEFTKKRKSEKATCESVTKKIKIMCSLEKDDGEDTGVSDNNEEYEGKNYFGKNKDAEIKQKVQSEESGFSDNDEDTVSKEVENANQQPSTLQNIVQDEMGVKRQITYQMAKNKGLTPHRKKEQRNPRVKHKLKYKKAKIRRKGAVREPRTELTRYGGESSGIKANLKKSIKIK